MQKLADGQDTEVGSSLAWLWSRCVAAPQPGAAPAVAVVGWLLAAGSVGADAPVHPVAAPVSRMAAHAPASRSRPVMCACMVLRDVGGNVVDEGGQPGLVEQVGGADGHVVGDVVEGGPDLRHGNPGQRGPGQAVGGELDGDRLLL